MLALSDFRRNLRYIALNSAFLIIAALSVTFFENGRFVAVGFLTTFVWLEFWSTCLNALVLGNARALLMFKSGSSVAVALALGVGLATVVVFLQALVIMSLVMASRSLLSGGNLLVYCAPAVYILVKLFEAKLLTEE